MPCLDFFLCARSSRHQLGIACPNDVGYPGLLHLQDLHSTQLRSPYFVHEQGCRSLEVPVGWLQVLRSIEHPLKQSPVTCINTSILLPKLQLYPGIVNLDKIQHTACRRVPGQHPTSFCYTTSRFETWITECHVSAATPYMDVDESARGVASRCSNPS